MQANPHGEPSAEKTKKKKKGFLLAMARLSWCAAVAVAGFVKKGALNGGEGGKGRSGVAARNRPLQKLSPGWPAPIAKKFGPQKGGLRGGCSKPDADVLGLGAAASTSSGPPAGEGMRSA